jgi:hypothetical protein
MVPTNVFVRRFRVAAGGALPTSLIAGWESVVESCEESYDDNLDEYHFDLSVRDNIEHVLHDGPLQECPQMGWVREHVAALDVRFRALLQEDVVIPGGPGQSWWTRHPLKFAGAQTAVEYAKMGIHVEVRGT